MLMIIIVIVLTRTVLVQLKGAKSIFIDAE